MVAVIPSLNNPHFVENCLNELQQIFKEPLSQAHLVTIKNWVGLQNYEEGFTKICESRISFLASVRNNPNFRPHDTAESAVHFLSKDVRYGFLIRLSSEPGKITVSYKQIGKGIFHSRYQVRLDGKITDTKGNIYNNINELSVKISQFLSLYSRQCYPVPKGN